MKRTDGADIAHSGKLCELLDRTHNVYVFLNALTVEIDRCVEHTYISGLYIGQNDTLRRTR